MCIKSGKNSSEFSCPHNPQVKLSQNLFSPVDIFYFAVDIYFDEFCKKVNNS